MFYKKTLLATMIALTIAACGDNNGGEKQAKEAEARFRDYTTKISQSYTAVFSTSGVKEVKVELTDYQVGEQSSTAKGHVVFKMDPKLLGGNGTILVNASNTINHDDKLLKDKIVAISDTKYQVDTSGLGEMGKSPLWGFIAKLVDSAGLQTTFKENDVISQVTTFAPINYDFVIDDDKTTVQFKGVKLHTTDFNQKDLANPFLAAKVTGQFDGVILSNARFAVDMQPWNIDYTQDGKNNLDGKISPFKLKITNPSEKDIIIQSDNITMAGKNVSIDADAGLFLGKLDYQLNKLSAGDGQENFEFERVGFHQDIQKKADLYSSNFGFNVAPTTDFVLRFAGIPNLKINDATFDVTLNNISKTAVTLSTDIQQASVEQDVEKIKEIASKLMGELIEKKSNFDIDVAVDTQQGKATLKVLAKMSDDTDVTAYQTALANDDMTKVEELFRQNVEATAELVVPEAIVNATGMGSLVEQMAGNFVKKENGNYQAHIEYKAGHLTVNGQPVL